MVAKRPRVTTLRNIYICGTETLNKMTQNYFNVLATHSRLTANHKARVVLVNISWDANNQLSPTRHTVTITGHHSFVKGSIKEIHISPVKHIIRSQWTTTERSKN